MKIRQVIVISLLALLWASSVSASTLYVESSPWGRELINENQYIIKFNQTSYTTIEAGEYMTYGDFFSPAYCIDFLTPLTLDYSYGYHLTDHLSYNDTYYYKTSGQYAVWLMNKFSVGLGYDPSSLNKTDTASFTKSQAAAALQLAIWDAIYDFNGNDSFDRDGDGGIFSVDFGGKYANVSFLFNYFKDELVTSIDDQTYAMPTNRQFKVAVLDGGQDILVVVPEPTTMLLFGIGLLGLGAIGRKRRI